MTLQERLHGILTGKIPNRLTHKEILNGLSTIGSDLTRSNLSEWLDHHVSNWSLNPNQVHFWLTVLLFMPLKETPKLINDKDEDVREIARYRLEIGK